MYKKSTRYALCIGKPMSAEAMQSLLKHLAVVGIFLSGAVTMYKGQTMQNVFYSD